MHPSKRRVHLGREHFGFAVEAPQGGRTMETALSCKEVHDEIINEIQELNKRIDHIALPL
jgi:hypothetical protein